MQTFFHAPVAHARLSLYLLHAVRSKGRALEYCCTGGGPNDCISVVGAPTLHF